MNFWKILVIFFVIQLIPLVIDSKMIPIVFAFNKQDREDVMDSDELGQILGLDKIKKSKGKKINIKQVMTI